ncbi:hypothetical protein BD560DRAFT_392006 [Blakeslea trispora]|nr:hypothetical protein BD560DRAFT_392006 [Blakeslea trispora]
MIYGYFGCLFRAMVNIFQVADNIRLSKVKVFLPFLKQKKRRRKRCGFSQTILNVCALLLLFFPFSYFHFHFLMVTI